MKRFRRSTMAAIAGGLLVFLGACGTVSPGGNGDGSGADATRTATAVSVAPCSASGTATPAALAPTAAAPTQDDLSPLSDEFNDAGSLAGWKNLSAVEGWPSQIERMDVNATSSGALYLVPYTSTWFDDYHGVFLYKEVAGDFMATTRIKATGKHSAVPTSAYSLTGIMARAPRDGLTPATWRPGHENWVFITTGIGEAGFQKPQIETKTTVNSVSDLRLIPSAADWVDLRVARIGQTFVMLYRLPGASWELSRCFDRADLPARLQVGLNAYTDWNTIDSQFHGDGGAFNRTLLKGPQTSPDLIMRDDYLRFSRPPVPDAVKAQIAHGELALDAWLPFVMG
ncbi:MAG TPA: DUF1349 domain-containing protein [Ktedonobacterales bacterium]|nr:DUF1349 domain-containing protein [Ktedonobacterales bacterium]